MRGRGRLYRRQRRNSGMEWIVKLENKQREAEETALEIGEKQTIEADK